MPRDFQATGNINTQCFVCACIRLFRFFSIICCCTLAKDGSVTVRGTFQPKAEAAYDQALFLFCMAGLKNPVVALSVLQACWRPDTGDLCL